jgi:hypothetical protein
MQEPDMRVDPSHHLTIEFQNKPQHAMRRRMLRAKLMVKLRKPS